MNIEWQFGCRVVNPYHEHPSILIRSRAVSTMLPISFPQAAGAQAVRQPEGFAANTPSLKPGIAVFIHPANRGTAQFAGLGLLF
ncbi:hypothetical protein [Thiobaca trueperi]|uniref:hypothetical protein n=1 Tax=Thiobaca trueperi TaxID=127458 RepID=UPI0010528833|nr:hypothetical protein [Thiobaca trueperi]